MSWAVDFTPAARREFDRLDGPIQKCVSQKIDQLERHGPFLPGAKALHSGERLYRVRVGPWRVIYRVDFAERVITVAEIAHRSEAYR